MKVKISLFSLLLIVFTSCEPKKPKHKKLIDEYMKENLHDYSSYEPISFEIDTIKYITDVFFIDNYNILMCIEERSLNNICDLEYDITKTKSILEDINNWVKFTTETTYPQDITKINKIERDILMNRLSFLEKLLIRENNKFKIIRLEINNLQSMSRKIMRWEITHKYKTKNDQGNLILGTDKFQINEDMTDIHRSSLE